MANQISMTELASVIKSLGSEEIILDVRSADEYRAAHVPGAKNIPHDQVLNHLPDLKKFKRIYIHCQAGGRAGRATEALANSGLTNLVCVSGSGMKDWISAGLPVTSA